MADQRSLLPDLLALALVLGVVLAISGCSGQADQAQAGDRGASGLPSPHVQPADRASAAGNATASEFLAELAPDTFLISQGSPGIILVYPFSDDVASGTISIGGTLADKNISSVTVSINGAARQVVAENGSFRTETNLTGPGEIVVSAADSSGATLTRRLLLDGDGLPAPYEALCGFDPLDPDSDSDRTAANEADDGEADGFELLDGRLPCFVKCRAGAHPLAGDTDGDGLSDIFEIMKLIVWCDVAKGDTDGDGISDDREDRDNDGLTNGEEQELGSDPIVADTDRDGLDDRDEACLGTNATRADSDSDGLDDGFEAKVGSDPLKPDSDGDGVPDIDETHTYPFSQDRPRIDIAITGTGDIIDEFRAGIETSEHYAGHPAPRGPLFYTYPNDRVDSMVVTLPYPANITNPGNLAIVGLNDTIGMFLPVDSIVDELNRTVSGRIDVRANRPSRWGALMVGIFDVQALHDVNLEIAVFNAPISKYMEQSGNVLRINIPDTVVVSHVRRGPDGKLAVTNRTLRFFPTQDEVNARL